MGRRPQITEAMVARRAFEISLVERSTTPEQNWERARRELEQEAAAQEAAEEAEGSDQA
jgi:hypothetical protein